MRPIALGNMGAADDSHDQKGGADLCEVPEAFNAQRQKSSET